MQLSEFVENVIRETVEGVERARVRLGNHCEIAPKIHNGTENPSIQAEGKTKDGRSIYVIHFDVAVSISESSNKGGSGSIDIMGFKAGGDGAKETANSTVNRVSFNVPIAFNRDLSR
ncbi:hypothetical protein GLV89_09860 [Halomonas alkaliantarctica]|nr:hypothetical protein [Halomonas alkaliantarctica]